MTYIYVHKVNSYTQHQSSYLFIAYTMHKAAVIRASNSSR